MDEMLTIQEAVDRFLLNLSFSRSKNTARTYQNGMNAFREALQARGMTPDASPVGDLSEDAILWMMARLRNLSPSTERLYLTAATQFFEFLAAEHLLDVNLARIHLLIKQRARRPAQRLPQFPEHAIDTVLEHAAGLIEKPSEDAPERLRNLRDHAFLITLADTGLRVHEACNLRRGDIDWREAKALVVGKGNRQAVIRFSRRALAALKRYLAARAAMDGGAGRPLSALPVFARHDKGAGHRIEAITTATGRNIVNQRVVEALGSEALGTITPHSFRHYFVTIVLKASGNLKMAQELARHQNIAVTTRYAHLSDDELDRGYADVFDPPS